MTCHKHSKLKNMMKLESLLLKFILIKINVSFVTLIWSWLFPDGQGGAVPPHSPWEKTTR